MARQKELRERGTSRFPERRRSFSPANKNQKKCFSFWAGYCGAGVSTADSLAFLWTRPSLPPTYLHGAAVHAKASVELLPTVVDLARPPDAGTGEPPAASRAGRMVLIIGFVVDDVGVFL